MNLNEYIKQSYKRPNRKVLEGLGASEELIKYLMETPGNTNLNMIGSITNPGGGSDTGEVWYIGTVETGAECESATNSREVSISKTGIANVEALRSNPSAYSVSVNDVNLEVFMDGATPEPDAEGTLAQWTSGSAETPEPPAFVMQWNGRNGAITYSEMAYVPCDWTDEVKVYITKK